MLQPLLSSSGLALPPCGSCFHSSLTPAQEVRFSPLTPHLVRTSLRFCTVGFSLSSFTVGVEHSKPFAKYLSVPVMRDCRGTLPLVTSACHLRFVFAKASAAVAIVARLKCLDSLPLPILPPPPSWSSSLCSVTATPSPLSPPPPLAPYCPLFRGRSSVAIQKPAPVTPVLLAVANAVLVHQPETAQQRLLNTPCYPAIQHRFVPRQRSGLQVHNFIS